MCAAPGSGGGTRSKGGGWLVVGTARAVSAMDEVHLQPRREDG